MQRFDNQKMIDTAPNTQYDFNVEIDPSIFNPVYIPYLDNMSRIQIYYGGASSGKSHFIIGQRVIIDLMAGGRNYLICRQVGKTIKHSVFNQVVRTIYNFGVSDLFNINKSDFSITCVNGYQALFVGLDDVEKIKSIIPEIGVLTDIVIEEATETDRNTVKSLQRRQRGGDEETPKRLTLLFNPILQDHWIFLEYFAPVGWGKDQTVYSSPELSILKTWYIHNLFLTEQDKQDLLNETDKYFREVYTFGNWGVLGNLIFTNWVVADLNDPRSEYYLPVDQRVNRRNGGDFGFASDPAAIGCSHYDKKHKTIYVYDELYERDLTNQELATEIIRMIGNEKIKMDSSEPKSIKELQVAGVNAEGAKKGPDSINFGIQWLRGCKIVVDKSCINMANELRQYKWKEDAAGKPVSPPRPVGRNDHLIDGGLRYAYEDDMIEVNKKGRQWSG